MDEAEALCERVAVVDNGRIIAQGRPKDLIERLGAPRVVTHHGTLEDVFMALTGRHLRDD
jgi:ABC-2 type transport system ATP-binding protein